MKGKVPISFGAALALSVCKWNCEDKLNLSDLVFAGPVRWTGKKTKIELNPTAKDRTTGCGCANSDFFSVASCDVCRKIEKPKKTGLDRLQPVFRPVMCWTLLTHIFPEFSVFES